MLIYTIVFVILFLIEVFYLKYAQAKGIKDKPNHRSAHVVPTIRGGGVIFIPAIFLHAAFFNNEIDDHFIYFIISVLVVAITSFIDDLRELSAKVRIIFHFLAFTIAFYGLGLFNTLDSINILVIVGAYVFSLGYLNIYNFMDGINGITFLNAFISYVTFCIINAYVVQFTSQSLLIVFVLATIVFGFFNFRKQPKCFLGDVGSITIGFSIIYFTLRLFYITQNYVVFFMLGIYLLDGGWTIVERLFRKENIFEAHRRHLYQLFANEIKIPHLLISLVYFIFQLVLNSYVFYALRANKNNIEVTIGLSFILSLMYCIIKKRAYKKVIIH